MDIELRRLGNVTSILSGMCIMTPIIPLSNYLVSSPFSVRLSEIFVIASFVILLYNGQKFYKLTYCIALAACIIIFLYELYFRENLVRYYVIVYLMVWGAAIVIKFIGNNNKSAPRI